MLMCRKILIAGFIYCSLMLPLAGASERSFADLPNWFETPSTLVGEVRFRAFIFDIYDAQLVAPGGRYDGTPPYALKLSYLLDVEKKKIIETSLDEMRRQGTRDAAKLEKWAGWMTRHFPDMTDGDEAVMLALVDGGMAFYHNGVKQGQTDDMEFVTAFFGIWLSDDALKPDVSRRLRGLRAN
jgi:hypothetical protein